MLSSIKISAPATQNPAARMPRLGLSGLLGVPDKPVGLVLFAQSMGRLNPRSMNLGVRLREAGLATLLFDLLIPVEAADERRMFDVVMLAGRLAVATNWARRHPPCAGLPVGYFASGTAAAAALLAAASGDAGPVAALVLRDGRPDLAGEAIRQVQSPTLMLVGDRDAEGQARARGALDMLSCAKELVVLEGLGAYLDEPSALEPAIGMAGRWFRQHMTAPATIIL